MCKRHDEKQISACCQDYQNGKSIREILLRYSISKTTLYRWLKLQKTKDKRSIGINVTEKLSLSWSGSVRCLRFIKKPDLE